MGNAQTMGGQEATMHLAQGPQGYSTCHFALLWKIKTVTSER